MTTKKKTISKDLQRKIFLMGIKVEKEHAGTYRWIKAFYNKYKRWPTERQVFAHITGDHTAEDPMYYPKLKTLRL